MREVNGFGANDNDRDEIMAGLAKVLNDPS